MGPAYRKDIRLTIVKNLKRFVSIAVICALGVAMFSALRISCEDLRASADLFFDEQRLFDIQILSTLGLTEEDVEALAAVEGVSAAEGGYTESTYTDVAGERTSVEVKALSDQGLNEPYVVDGRLPETAEEIAVTPAFLDASGLAIGDAVELAAPDDEEGQVFARHAYTITGSIVDAMDVNNPELAFRATSGSDYTFFVSREAVTGDAYTAVYVSVEGASGLPCYSDAYRERVDTVKGRIEDEIRAGRETARTDSVRGEAQTGLDDARAEYEAERANAEAELADGLAKIEDGQAELDAGAAELDRSERDLADGWNAYYAGTGRLEAERTQAHALMDEGQRTLDERRSQLEDGFSALEEGEAELAAAEQALVDEVNGRLGPLGIAVSSAEDAREQLDALAQPVYDLQDAVEAGERRVSELEAEIASLDPVEDAEEIARLEQELADARAQLQTDRQAFEQALAIMEGLGLSMDDLDAAFAGIDRIVAGKQELATRRDQLEQGKAKLDEGQAELDRQRRAADESFASAGAGLEAARSRLAQGEAQLPAAWAEIDAAQAELDRARAEWQEGRAEADEGFAEAEAELADAQADVDAIEAASWYVQDRTSLSSYSAIASDADSIEAIGRLFPVVFLVVAVLVALTAVTRMVEEERGLIGTYKALGYRNREIYAKYVVYALAACVAGSALGFLLGFVGLPLFIFTIFDIMYVLPGYPILFDPVHGFGGAAIFVVAIVGTTFLACRGEVRQVPAALLRPKAPKAGSRIVLERVPALWRRMSFLNKVTARNLFRYKRRFLMTVAGIMGCTALIVCGFIIRDSVRVLLDRQYGSIVRYDVLAVTDAADLPDVAGELARDERVGSLGEIYTDSVTLRVSGDEESVQLVAVPEGVDLSSYIRLGELGTGEPLALPAEGAVVTQNAADVMGFSTGDTVSVQDSALDEAEVPVEAVAENYLGNYVFMSEAAYERAFGELEPNGLLISMADEDAGSIAFADELANDGRYLSVTSNDEFAEGFEKSLALINAVVVIVLGMAAALAFTVLFTLSTTNISERERELATIKVLGFRPGEVHHYVNKETLILTAIGIVAGLPLGYVLGDALLQSLKMPSISFLTTISPASYAVAALLPLAFAVAVNLITNRTLNRIDMISALKSVE